MLVYTLEELRFKNWHPKLVGSFDLLCVNLIHQKKVRIHTVLLSVFHFPTTSSMRVLKKSLKKLGCMLKQSIKLHIETQVYWNLAEIRWKVSSLHAQNNKNSCGGVRRKWAIPQFSWKGKDWIKDVCNFWRFGNEILVTLMLFLKYISSCSCLAFKANYRLKFHIQYLLDNLSFMSGVRLLFHAVFIAWATAVIHSSSRLLFPVDQR